MRLRAMVILTAVVSSILGAIVVYLVLTVPNDLQAGAMLRAAKKSLAAHDNDKARATLSKIVQQYPRTDAAAAATVALVALSNDERQQVANEVTSLKRVIDAQQKALAALGAKVDAAAVAPPPAPPPVVKAAPEPVKKKAPVKKTSRRRRRR
jgi:cell division protein FtsL